MINEETSAGSAPYVDVVSAPSQRPLSANQPFRDRSLADLRKRGVDDQFREIHARRPQSHHNRTCRWDKTELLRQEDQSECPNARNPQRTSATAGFAVIDHGPRRLFGQRKRQNSRFTRTEIPQGDYGLDSGYGHDFQPIDTIDRLHSGVVRAVAMDFVDHGLRDDNLKSSLPQDVE
jgi:hypothetical protein